jgi:tRNA threonylcarbamoyl adenosine modification protein (Sua5/YciO/YrdC/YwlC family)
MILKLYDKNNDFSDLQQVLQVLNDGGIIIYPTDTMYALGCHALKERAVERICQLKKIDPRKHHLSILCYDLSDLSEYAKMDNPTFKLMKRNLPGPFTFILPAGNRLPKIFRNRKEVGIRISSHPIVRELCRLLEAPILTTTLPVDEGEDPEYQTHPELIEEMFGRSVDLIIDGGIGGLEPSTVIRCTEGDYEIVRQGKGELME